LGGDVAAGGAERPRADLGRDRDRLEDSDQGDQRWND